MPSTWFFLFRIPLAVGFFVNFRIVFSNCKECHWYFDRDWTGSVNGFGQYRHFVILILLIHEQGIFFHFLCPFEVFHQCLIIFIVERSFTTLVKFVPKYLIIFVAVVNAISFLIALSMSSSLAYKTATVFCKFIL